jgi:DNA-binding transcriptional MerR regulator
VGEYRIDDLARKAGTTVRSLRVLHDRRLLPPPELRGRTGYYDDHHVARVRLVLRLQERGYTLAAIGELLGAWETGRDLADVLGFADALTRPWNEETPRRFTLGELRRRFGTQLTPAAIRRAVSLGLLKREGVAFRARSPRLIDVGTEMVAAGLPLTVVLDLTAPLQQEMRATADRMTKTVGDFLSEDLAADGLPEAERVAAVADTIQRLSSEAKAAVEVYFAQAMEQAVADYVGGLGDWVKREEKRG